MSPVKPPNYGHNEHFTEILARTLSMNLISLSRGACGNNVIRLQIEEAIKMNPAFVIIGATSEDRIEIPFIGGTFDPAVGLSNINYKNFPDVSSELNIFKYTEPSLISETINNIFSLSDPRWHNISGSNKSALTEEQMKIIKDYFLYCYNSSWKKQLDTWVIAEGLRKLDDFGIPYVFITSGLPRDNFYFCDDKIANFDMDPRNYPSNNTAARFHVDLKDSYILAEKWVTYINSKGLLQ